MEHALTVRLFAEFFGTMFLIILGNGAVANTELKNTKGNHTGWLNIAFGYGAGVGVPVIAFGAISAHINPAFTLGLAIVGAFPWAEVAFYIVAQLAGAMIGQLIVVGVYKPYFDATTNPDEIFAPFSTDDAAGSRLNGFLNEGFGTFVLVFAAMAIGATPQNKPIEGLALGILVASLVTSLGGATGPALNPARDLGPRLMHAGLPLQHKGSSHWDYAWVPVVAPIVGATVATILYTLIFK
ncbi:MIP/aquaporin family protein [Weissella viridescens]|uniref:MIP/aquaporin family protein n=1 Tax=Weissella viridescens TaxID=1629 RepID=UPI003AF26060